MMFVCCRLRADSCKCESVLLKAFSSRSASYSVKMKHKETHLDMKSDWPAAESAASNERLLEVSNKRITSFVGFQKISGYLSAHSASLSEPWPFTDGGGRGFSSDRHPSLPPRGMMRPSGGADISAVYQTNRRLIHMEKCDFIVTFQLGCSSRWLHIIFL